MGAEFQEHILSQEKEADGKAKINSDPGMDVLLKLCTHPCMVRLVVQLISE